MSGMSVDLWRPEGRLHVWHYPEGVKGMEGWHLNADATACRNIADLIDRMLATEWATHRTLPVTVPDQNRMGKGVVIRYAAKLLLAYPNGEVDDSHWQLELREGDVLALTLGAAKLRRLRQSLLELPDWNDDYALGPDVDTNRAAGRERWCRECLWFWTKID